ncbi:MAG: hypothetical protein E6J90_41740 [Deltaproteobacteria bacterium]|nr:MAG: hypothetical protein E6J90_41740 [Deltaproteobacteria bacterium]TMQ11215.1 MAG: hypothetical protein E6J91_23930 [Deltaproteobacteria bacterium]
MRGTPFALACALAGCGADDAPAPMTLSLLKQTTDSCYLLVGGDTPARSLTFPFKLCDTPGITSVIAGATQLELIADYGALEFSESTAVPTPTITMTLDGAASPTPLGAARLPQGGRAVFGASFVAPAHPGAQLAFLVSATAGFEQDLGAITLAAPDLAMTIEPCPTAGPCSMVSSVGSVTVHVTVSGTTTQPVTLTSTLDRITQPDRVTIMATEPASPDHVSGMTSLPVPAGTTWQLTASAATTPAVGPVITLAPPVIRSALACGARCAADSTTELVVIAPRFIHPATAAVDITVAGAPVVTAGTVTLTEPDVVHDTISGRMSVVFPAKPSAAVAIEVNVAGYRANTLQTVLAP